MMDCSKVTELLADYRTGTLPARQHAQVDSHLQHCAKCREELRALDSVMDIVQANLGQTDPPPGLWNGVYERIAAPEAEPVRLADIVRTWLARPVHAVGIGAAAAALILAGIYGTISRGPHEAIDFASPRNSYVQTYALSASHSPLADRVGYISLVALSDDTAEPNTR